MPAALLFLLFGLFALCASPPAPATLPAGEPPMQRTPRDAVAVDNAAVAEMRATWPRAGSRTFGGFVAYADVHAPGAPRPNLPPVETDSGVEMAAYRDPTDRNLREGLGKMAQLGAPIVLDVEHLPTVLGADGADDATVQAAHDELANLIALMRQYAPGARVGMYGVMPVRDYWTPVNLARRQAHVAEWEAKDREAGTADTAAMLAMLRGKLADAEADAARWREANARFMVRRTPDGAVDERGLADVVDVIYPSLYPFYNDPEGNAAYAAGNLAEARRYGKPVIPYVRPVYHESNKTLARQPIALADILPMYRVIRREADGVVIWDGGIRPWGRSHAEHLAAWEVLRDEPELTDAQVLGRVARHPLVSSAPADPPKPSRPQ